MSSLLDRIRSSAELCRVAPYIAFVLLTVPQTDGWFGEGSRYWLYLVKTAVGAWILWELRRQIPEMKWAWGWEAVAVGIGVFVIWVALDPFYPRQDELWFKLGLGKNPADKAVKLWNPFEYFGNSSSAGWFIVAVRIAGSSLVVPPIEEIFFRSFVYRYLISPEFERVPLNRWHPTSLAMTSIIFGFTHAEWFAGILCGVAYQWLVLRKNRIGDAMTAHAITNLLLGLWVVVRGDWKFW